MKYEAPYGVSDPNAGYINGDPSIGRQGSIPPAAAIEYPQREIVEVISANGYIPTDADLTQLTQATRSQRVNFVKDTGSVNTMSVALDPPLQSYTLGLPLRVLVYATNTGGSSLDAGCGRAPVRRPDGSNTQPGDLPAAGIVDLVWDGTVWQMVNYLGGASSGSVINNFNNIPYAVDSSITPNIITANFAPPITTLVAGTIFLVKIANTCTADTVINVNTFTNEPVRTNGGDRLLPGDVQAGDIKLFTFDGTNFHLDPDASIPVAVTLNVPSTQFPDPQTTLNLLLRKTFAAKVTIKLAAGIYSPIIVNHKDASRLTIQGTMLTAAPIPSQFAQTGNTAAARAADAANNIVMLRSRYGSEINIVGSNAIGFSNFGPGDATLQDMLITGDRAQTNVAGVATDWSFPLATTNLCVNVAIWGCYWGYYCGGMQRISAGSVCNCYVGPTALNGAHIHISGPNFITCGNDVAGLSGGNGGLIIFQNGCQSNVNGYYGAMAINLSTIVVQGVPTGCVIQANGSFDAYASDTSEITLHAVTIYSFNPPINSSGNFNATIRGM